MVPWLWGCQSIFWRCEQVLIVVLAFLCRPLVAGGSRLSMPCRHRYPGSAHRITALLTVFNDRPSISIFVYLCGDGFLMSSGNIAPLPLYVLAFTHLPSDHITDSPILIYSVYYIKIHIFLASYCPLPVSLFCREHLPEMDGAVALAMLGSGLAP
jgi:hypothetical protein